MTRMRFAVTGLLFLVCVMSCNDASKPDPGGKDQAQSVTFTLTKMDALGDCDTWDCEATAGSGKSDFRGTVYLQLDSNTRKSLYSISWDDAGGTKTVNKSMTFTVTKGQKVTISASGLKDSDSTSGDEELTTGKMEKTFYYPVEDYPDLQFECAHHTPSADCYCALRFHWTITAKYVD